MGSRLAPRRGCTSWAIILPELTDQTGQAEKALERPEVTLVKPLSLTGASGEVRGRPHLQPVLLFHIIDACLQHPRLACVLLVFSLASDTSFWIQFLTFGQACLIIQRQGWFLPDSVVMLRGGCKSKHGSFSRRSVFSLPLIVMVSFCLWYSAVSL